jgi:hypothetical protein
VTKMRTPGCRLWLALLVAAGGLRPSAAHGETRTAAGLTPEASAFSSDDGLTSDPDGRDFDEAPEHISSEGWCVCPLCGAIVARDGTVLG